MREIKFRAWDGKEMRKPSVNMLVCSKSGSPMWQFAYDPPMPEPCWVLMQYTGLKDANGVEIFEGDILRSENIFLKNRSVVVEFENGRFIGRCAPNKLGIEGLRNLTDQPAEVIGNIYEHSHLMSGVEGA